MTRQLKNRMAVGGIVHETVSYLPAATPLADFERRAVRGDEIAEAFAGSNTVFGVSLMYVSKTAWLWRG